MKVGITSDKKNNEVVDWNKSQIMVCGGEYVITNGEHSDIMFSGFALQLKEWSDSWCKSSFSVASKDLVLTIQND